MAEKKFNPFYDSDFLISREGSDERRMLVELCEDELIQLRSEVDAVLEHLGVTVESVIADAHIRSTKTERNETGKDDYVKE